MYLIKVYVGVFYEGVCWCVLWMRMSLYVGVFYGGVY